jgi:CRISPR/Cas system-associated exonuclease Cas4 (RecB family)
MPKPSSRKVIRASEIGTYLYCRRAWWYRLQGIAPENQAALQQGRAFHESHAGQVRRVIWMRRMAFALLLLALLLSVAAALAWLVP